jgi:hypothetical protein
MSTVFIKYFKIILQRLKSCIQIVMHGYRIRIQHVFWQVASSESVPADESGNMTVYGTVAADDESGCVGIKKEPLSRLLHCYNSFTN